MSHSQEYTQPATSFDARPQGQGHPGRAEIVHINGYERRDEVARLRPEQTQKHLTGSQNDPVTKLRIPGGLEDFVAKLDGEDFLATLDSEIENLIIPADAQSQEPDHGVAAVAQEDAVQSDSGQIKGDEMAGESSTRHEENDMTDEAPTQSREHVVTPEALEPEAPRSEPEVATDTTATSEIGPQGSKRMQLAGERQGEWERMEKVMAQVSRGLPVLNPTLLDTSEQLDFIRKVGLAIAELDWFAVGDSPERLRLANALMNYRYQLQGLTRDLNRSNKVIAKIRRETKALEKNLESARRVARQLGTSRRHLRSNRDYESELRKVILLQDRVIELNKREAKEQYIRREVMKKAHDMNQELREFAARLETHAGNRLGAVAAIGRTG